MESDAISRLKAIIEKHAVRFQVWPHYELQDGKQVMVGFDLELHGPMITATPVFPLDAASAPRPLQICGR